MIRPRLLAQGRRLGSLVGRPQLWVLLVTALLAVVTAGQVAHNTIKLAAPTIVLYHPHGAAGLGVHDHMVQRAGIRERAVRGLLQDCHKVACIALTFDDGPNAATTPRILDILEANHVPASFFIVGSHIGNKQPLLQRMYANGYEVGNHSWSHSDLTKLDIPHMQEQVRTTQRAIRAAGIPAPLLLRPPYGAVNDTVRAVASANRLSLMFWNEDPVDWKAKTSEEVVARVEAAAHPGGVVIMHDIYPTTVQALPVIIQKLRNKGYQFATPSQMLDIAPGEPGDFYGHPPQ